jgi:hypothetical protein
MLSVAEGKVDMHSSWLTMSAEVATQI